MISDLKPYAEYKESGLPWLGQVPGHWEVRRLRHACEMRVSNVDKHTKRGETPVRLCNYVDVYKNERITQSTRFMAASATEDERLRFRLLVGDVLITKDSEQWNDIGVPALVEHEAPDLVCGYHLAILRPRFGLCGPFLHRALESHFIAAQFHVEANGVTRYGLSHGAILGVAIPLPPPDEQAAIVRFLDWANGRLERAIRAKRKVIALLNEQKQAIIHRAVTRGLDPSVPLKPSGVPWLGEIPKHWEVRRLKSLARFQSGDGITSLEIEANGPYPVYGGNGLRGYTTRFTHAGHYALIGRQGALCGNINFAQGQFFASEHAVVPTLQPEMSVVWFGELLRSMNLNQYSQSAAQPGLAVERLRNLYAPVPPATEQVTIVKSFERDTAPLATTISRLEREITLLREYRTRLVADVVTGKLDVRAAAAALPNEAPLDDATASPDPDDALDTDDLSDTEADA